MLGRTHRGVIPHRAWAGPATVVRGARARRTPVAAIRSDRRSRDPWAQVHLRRDRFQFPLVSTGPATCQASRLLQTFTWALVPTQPDPGAPFLIRESKVEGQSDALADRVSRRLGNDGDLSTRQAAATIRLAIGKVPQIWKDGHVSLGSLWGLYSQYPYMPRLRDRAVLDAGILDLPMIWQTDAFALAAGFDQAAGRYIGLWTPDDKETAPVAIDSLLLVRPDVAQKQRSKEPGSCPAPDPETGSSPTLQHGPGPTPKVDFVWPTRFYGVKTLNSDKIAQDFRNVAEEVLAHLRSGENTSVTVRIEIEATDSGGFTENRVRTVSENARTLKFDQSGFEQT